MYSITVFKDKYDNKTNKRVDYPKWDMLEALLFDLSRKEGVKGGPNSVPLISPARYRDGTTRSNFNVDYWSSWCAMDVDEFVIESKNKIDLRNKIESVVGDYYFLCYSTASSTKEHPKFRLVFPLTTDVQAVDIKHFWYALNCEISGLGDKQTKDLSRMFYIPALYPGAYNFFFRHKSHIMDPDVLMQKWPYTEPTGNSFMDRLPDDVRRQIVEHRKRSLTKTNISWSGYSNCPFWPKKLEKEYRSISDTGWYHTMYRIMVALGFNAIKAGYPITPQEVSRLCTEFDASNGNWYKDRPMLKEADRALEYCYNKG
jgi:hypothetical protein